jgi:hypothetical protein
MESDKIEKIVWTEADFDKMGWHDAHIWGMIANPDEFEYLIDMDYIFEWINPKEDEEYYKFLISPVTMVFENAYDIRFDIESQNGEIEISDLYMENSRKTKNGNLIEHTFRFECQQGNISLIATGFKMYVRQNPILLNKQSFDFKERGGINFERKLKAI